MTEYIEREKVLNEFDDWIDSTGALTKHTSYYTFSEYGYYFAKHLLQYIGCDADFV